MGRYSYVFLLATVLLGLLLASPLGTGPGTSDAKVNLFFFQPVEIMRILIVFFLAGYFAADWDVLRDLRHKKGWLAAHFHVPRLDYAIPAVEGRGGATCVLCLLVGVLTRVWLCIRVFLLF